MLRPYRWLIGELIAADELIPVFPYLVALAVSLLGPILVGIQLAGAISNIIVIDQLPEMVATILFVPAAPILWASGALIVDRMWSAVGIYSLLRLRKHAMRDWLRKWASAQPPR